MAEMRLWGSISRKVLIPLVLLTHFALPFSQALNADEICYPSDYLRVSEPCSGGTRTVTFQKQRNCTDPFTVTQTHTVPCECSPEDYFPVYEKDPVTSQCLMYYHAQNCDNPIPTAKTDVDDVFCELTSDPCTEQHVLTYYSPCDYAKDPLTGERLHSEPTIEVIYYFDNTCNPGAKGSMHLPVNTYMPCTFQCGAGNYLVGTECKECSPGSFSTGGVRRFENFTEMDPAFFSTKCSYTNASGSFECSPWRVEGSFLYTGPFDPANNWFQDECASAPEYDCHNNLKSSLYMNVKLAREGYVKFAFTVSAERIYDGLAFSIDVTEKPEMVRQSLQFSPQEVVFNLSEGYHTLVWDYLKDEKWTGGEDIASLKYIEVGGLELNDLGCTPCPEGTSSAENRTMCIPCALNTYSAEKGSLSCLPCPDGTFSAQDPQISCTPKEPCDIKEDAHVVYSPCDGATNTRTKTYVWVQPHICKEDPANPIPQPEQEQCPPCPVGHVSVMSETSHYRTCKPCPQGTVRPADATQCQRCEAGSVPVQEFYLSHLDPTTVAHVSPENHDRYTSADGSKVGHTAGLPPGFSTGCGGKCGRSKGWRYVNGVFMSGRGHGSTTSVWLAMNVTIGAEVGSVSYNFSLHIPPNDTHRGLFFYVDNELQDALEQVDPDESVNTQAAMGGPVDLTPGQHELMWVYAKFQASLDTPPPYKDQVYLYDVQISGVVNGSASFCESISPGFQISEDGLSTEECAPGTFSAGGDSNCTNCPENTFNPGPKGGAWACEQCGAGTSAYEGSAECMIGNFSEALSFCTYQPPFLPTSLQRSQGLTFDLSALVRLHPEGMYGPVYDNPRSESRNREPMYWISPCGKDYTNASCYKFNGDPLETYMCKTEPSSFGNGHSRPGFSVGDRVALYPLHVLNIPPPGMEGGEQGRRRLEESVRPSVRSDAEMMGSAFGKALERFSEADVLKIARREMQERADPYAGTAIPGANPGTGETADPYGSSGTTNPGTVGGTAAPDPYAETTTDQPGELPTTDPYGTGTSQEGGAATDPYTGTGTMPEGGAEADPYGGNLPGPTTVTDPYGGEQTTTELPGGPTFDPYAGMGTENLTYVQTEDTSPQYGMENGTNANYQEQLPPPGSDFVPIDQEFNTEVPGVGLYSDVTLSELSITDENAVLLKRGFVMRFSGGSCAHTGMERTADVAFICAPEAGFGFPSAWTDKGRVAAVDPTLIYPHYVNRGGKITPVENKEICRYEMVWYSAFACPLCTVDDMEQVTVSNCIDNKLTTWKYKEPKLCQPSPFVTSQEDSYCSPCMDSDFLSVEDACRDSEGRHNVTFHWKEPKTCNENQPDAVKLPEALIVGQCKDSIIVRIEGLAPKYIAIFVLGGILIVVLAIISLTSYIRTRRMYSMYAKLVEDKNADALDDEDEEDEEEDGEEEERGLAGDRERDDEVGEARV